MAELWNEIRKIPSVTRFLCGSSLLVTVPVMLEIVSPYSIVFVKELVTRHYQVWRVFTSFFLGSSGINYIFDFVMLYRNSSQLETAYYARRSADYAWQLLLAGASILVLNIPLHSFVHTRPLLLALTYLSSRLAPPGSQTSLFGLISFPVVYLPFALILLDLLMGGRAAAVQSISGAIVGHLWWWGVWDTGVLRRVGTAPAWMKALVGDGGGPATGGAGSTGGVHVVPPRRLREEAQTSGHRWGTGNRLGDS
ncbi:DER1-domain-containing protein [Laetiporus sulphureus 93-53]|uniref:Derlin n=1 Tax=Laetiporus sulphureus 93-53 TaxID=1314785 RepID=A0A165BB89_9APHY|nr:DER1-domain-containing protein [Laetiporus sulphureus 93-53]KZT00662.1 DER1-domain-containing protein [Laetiporus sulphureus 93-53]